MLVSQHIIDRILEFDYYDEYNNAYHIDDKDLDKHVAYSIAIDRVVALLKGDITDWKDR